MHDEGPEGLCRGWPEGRFMVSNIACPLALAFVPNELFGIGDRAQRTSLKMDLLCTQLARTRISWCVRYCVRWDAETLRIILE